MGVVVIAAGGTGGHLYPAVAVARELSELHPESDPLFVGSGRDLESGILRREGFRHASVSSSPWKRDRPWTLAGSLFSAFAGARQAGRLLDQEKTRVVFSTGGYATIPTLLAALLRRIPVVLHEPDSVPGMANRLFGRFAARVTVGSEEARARFPLGRTIYTGVPIRRRLLGMTREEARTKLGLGSDRRVLLVLGGSQGARALNRAVAAALPAFKSCADRLALVWLCGERDLADLKPIAAEAGMPVRLFGYLDEMELGLNAADLALARAGASTCAEMLACGLPSILVPYPHATADHQRKNAEAAARTGAAEIMEEKDLGDGRLADRLMELAGDDVRLEKMRKAALAAARPEAGRRIAEEVISLVGSAC